MPAQSQPPPDPAAALVTAAEAYARHLHAQTPNKAAALPSWLLGLVAHLPEIIAIFMSLFGQSAPAPQPVPGSGPTSGPPQP